MMKWLNPATWVKAAVAAKVESEVEKRLSKAELETVGREAVNYLIELSKSRIADDKVRAVSSDLVFCGNALIELGVAVDPDGQGGRQITEQEAAALNARIKVLFGDIITEEQLTAWREKIVAVVRENLGV